ncbi:uncharacterized protein [Littorina saxatilis]|uniref:uncharacterized protein n=1 Tax=Littorina saxatilis TaxID=31220 RepID=UPI0038B45913
MRSEAARVNSRVTALEPRDLLRLSAIVPYHMPRRRNRIGTKPKGARSKQNAASKRNAETKRQLLQLAELETDTDPAWTWGDFLLGVEDRADPAESIIEDEVAMELTDLDGDTAQGFFMIVGEKAFRYEPDQDVDDLVASLQASCRRQVFQKLTQDVKSAFQDSDSVCVLLLKECKLRLTSMYDSSIPSLKFCLSISDDLSPSLVVHQGIIPPTHDFWIGLPRYLFTATDVLKVLDKVENWSICSGNCEEQFRSLVPVGVPFCDTTMKRAACCDTTIRSTKCHLLIRSGGRCQFCSLYSKTPWKAGYRNKAKMEAPQGNNLMSSKIPHARMSRDDLCLKVTQLREANRSLSGELERLRRDVFKEIKDKGQTLSEVDDFDLVNMLKSSKSDVESAYLDENSLPRIFWEQQLRHANNKTARWHPMVIRWCLYMRSKSAKAYDAMRAGYGIYFTTK